MTAWVLHVDLDEFLAAVEVLRRPELAGLPVVVGARGDPTERGVVSTASYAARELGIRSGVPLRTARRIAQRVAERRGVEVVFLPVDRPVYEAASEEVMATLRAVPGATVQVLGWDEAFVGVETNDPEAVARRIQADVLAATGLHCSVGIGDTTTRAKIATGFGKPRGVATLTRDTWLPVMGERPTTAIWGIGPRVAARLARHGIETVADLASADPDVLVAEFGPTMGPHYGRLGRGGGHAHVDDTPWVPRAHGRETTFQRDLSDRGEVEAAVHELATQVVEDIRREGRPCARVHLKVRFAPFFTVQRSRKLPAPTYDAPTIAATALDLLDRLEDDRAIRLLGVRAEMVPPTPDS